MMITKQIVVVLEATNAMSGYWQTIINDYLVNLLRAFNGNSKANKDKGHSVQLCMVQFNAHGTRLVQRGPWIDSLVYFIETLRLMPFNGGDFCDAAIAEGLAEVLMAFPPPNKFQIDGVQRHCILLAASNPYPLSTPVYRPPDNRGQPQSPLCDAETLVKSFHQCRVSLSVICPRQLPKLKSIYYAGKRNPSAVDHTINNVKNPHFLVLISDDFKLACADLNQTELTVLPLDHPEAASGSGTPSTSATSGWRSVPVELFHLAPAKSSGQSNITSMPDSATSSGAVQLSQHTATDPGLSTLDMSQLQDILGQPSGAAQLAQHTATDPDLSTLDLSQLLDILGQPLLEILTRTSESWKKGVGGMSVQTIRPAAEIRMPVVKALVQSLPPGQVKVWEVYRKPTDPALLAEDWPSTMTFSQTITQEKMLKWVKRVDKVYALSFVAMHHHRLLERLQELEHSAVIQLPSQRLMLSVNHPASVWTGAIFPGEG
ncbi:hypothetical protein QVD17_18460 [Tagetes erecta]|uniref:Mediator of RNA polymerase II transcription subunit 25 n=1 Tax=Tagetes erecta TaxID=13708 RepID=A0AAD8NP07_TARER|nr:hypothetical protein QVD17_18460 [Tagetes erecta]